MTPEIIIQRYCNSLGISPDDLETKGRTPKRIVNNVHLDYVRMCLAYYLRLNGIIWKQVSSLSGYKCHSSPIKNNVKMVKLIGNKNELIYPYWEKLIKIVTPANN